MKQTAFFLLLFTLCFFACTKVSQFSPNAQSASPVPSSIGAKQYASNGPCPMPGPASLTVTSPSQPGPLQQFNITWSTIPGVTGYVVKVLNQNTNALVYCMEVPPVAGPFESHLTGANAQNPGFGGFAPFVSYKVMVYSSCKSNPGNCNDDLGGWNEIESVIITGGPVTTVSQDLEKNYIAFKKGINEHPTNGISVLGCSLYNIFAPIQSGASLTTGPLTFGRCGSGSVSFLNLSPVNPTASTLLRKIKLNIKNASVGDYLAVYTYPSPPPPAAAVSVNCNDLCPTPSGNCMPTWSLTQFKVAESIAVELDINKKYRFQLFSGISNTSVGVVNQLINNGVPLSYPFGQNNTVLISCQLMD